MFAAEKKLIREIGVQPGPEDITQAAFSEVVRRGLLEVDFRKLARLADDYSKRSFDPLFDPTAAPPMTFCDLVSRFLEAWIEEAKANGINKKSIDRRRANVWLLRKLIGDNVLVSDLALLWQIAFKVAGGGRRHSSGIAAVAAG